MNGIAATSSSPHRTDMFWLDPDFAVNHKSGDGTQWDLTPEDLGGSFVTVPAAVAGPGPGPGLAGWLDVFGVGTDFAMYHRSFDGAQWSPGWENLGGTFISAPGAYKRPNGMIDLFGVGLDFAMYHRFSLGSKRGNWQRLGGTFSSTASAVSFNPARLDVFARGADFTLRHRSLVSSTWSADWQNLGGSLASPPVAVSWGPDRLDVFAVGISGGLIHRWWDGELWSDWEDLGGSLTATPSAVAWGPGRIDVFALGTDRAVWHYWWDNQAWSGRESFEGDFTSGPRAISPAPNRIDLLAPGTDGDIYDRTWDGTSWQPPLWDQVGAVKIGLPTRYRFSVDYVRAVTTRALDSDTDAAQASIGAGNWPTQTKTQWIGDIGGLTSPDESQTNLLEFEPVTVELCEAAVFNYLVLNNGHADRKAIDSALVNAGQSLTSGSVSSISKDIGAGIGAILGVEIAGAIMAPVIGSLLGSLVGWLLGQLGDIVFADCDGLVAAEQLAYTGRDLYLKTVDGPLKMTTTHPGTDSPTICGANSQYDVTWTISQV